MFQISKITVSILLIIACLVLLLHLSSKTPPTAALAAFAAPPADQQKAEQTGPDRLRQLYQQRQKTLQRIADTTEAMYKSGLATQPELARAQAAALRAQIALCDSRAQRFEIHQKIVQLYKDAEASLQTAVEAGAADMMDLEKIRVAHLQAQIRLLKDQLENQSR